MGPPVNFGDYEVRPPKAAAAAGGDEYEVRPPTGVAGVAAGTTKTEEPTPGFFKRAWAAINTPIGSHLAAYNKETEQLNRVQNFAETEAGRQAYMKHPILTGAKSVAAGIERDAADLLTPGLVVTALAPGVSAAAQGAVPEVAGAVNVVGKAARVAVPAGFGVAGVQQVAHAVGDTSAPIEQRAQEALGGAAALMGTAAEVGRGVRSLEPARRLRGTAQEVLQAGEDFQKKQAETYGEEAAKIREKNVATLKKDVEARREALRKNREAVSKRQEKVGQTSAENVKSIAAHRDRLRVQTQLQQASQQLDQKIEQARAKAEADNNAAWNQVREKTGNIQTEIAPLRQIVEVAARQAEPASSPLFKSILATPQGEAGYAPEVTEYPLKVGGKEISPNDPQYPVYYEALHGQPPAIGEVGGAATFPRLQRWYSYINNRMYGGGGRLEAGTYNALKMVRNGLNDAMNKIAEQTGATEDLENARRQHTEMMETFSDSPNEPATVASQFQQERTPEFVKQQKRQERLQKIARYDPEVASLATHVENLQTGLKALPKPLPFREQVKPLPGPAERISRPQPTQLQPEPEVPDIRQQTREQLQNTLKKYGRVGTWVARTMIGTGAGHLLMHGDLTGFGGQYIIGEAGVQVLSRALRSDRVLDWMSKPTSDTLKAIDSLPPQDAAKLRQALTGLAVEDAKSGGGGKIDSGIARFLGSDNLALITAAVAASYPKTAGEAKKRVDTMRNQLAGQQ